jgi:hypothetical protein
MIPVRSRGSYEHMNKVVEVINSNKVGRDGVLSASYF